MFGRLQIIYAHKNRTSEREGPKWLACCSLELVTTLLETLHEAKNQEEYHLRKEALLKTMEADRVVALAAEVSGRPTQKPQNMWNGGSSENANTRRLRKHAEKRASAQAEAEDAAAEAEVRDEQEAAAGVAAGVEEAKAGQAAGGAARSSGEYGDNMKNMLADGDRLMEMLNKGFNTQFAGDFRKGCGRNGASATALWRRRW